MFPSDDNLDFKVTMESDASSVLDDDPFHILVLGDWSGDQGAAKLPEDDYETQLLEIDRDNFDDVLKKLNPALDLNFNNGQNIISLQFTELDDFHPDRIFEQVSVFSDLRSLRRRLSESDTFEKASAEVRSWLETEGDKNLLKAQTQTQPSEITYLSSAQLLEDILSKPEQTISPPTSQTDELTGLNALVSKLVKPFLVKTDEKEQSKLISAVDEAISDLMQNILHHPKFKELESAWRGLYFLIRGVETDSRLKIFLFDISKTELSAILKSSDDNRKFSFFKILENNRNIALICGNYSFQINVDDIALLVRIAEISNTVNAPFVSHLDAQSFGKEGFTESQEFNYSFLANDSPEAKLWKTIRTIPEAESIGLLIQRLLIRLPYGEETEPTEKFSFEEFREPPTSNLYLWANPCFALALLLAQNYSLDRWKLGDSLYSGIEGLPTFIIVGDADTSKIIPKSEFVMTEQLCRDILQAGLMPILNYRNSDEISLAGFQSIAFPKKLLKGKWN